MRDKKSIVVLDDDPLSLQYFRELLSSHYKVIFFTEHELARNFLKTSSTDLVITDVSLVGTSGFEFAKQVRAFEQHTNIPFIFISGFSSGRVAALADSFSHAGFAAKDSNPEDILGLISSLLSTH